MPADPKAEMKQDKAERQRGSREGGRATGTTSPTTAIEAKMGRDHHVRPYNPRAKVGALMLASSSSASSSPRGSVPSAGMGGAWCMAQMGGKPDLEG